MKEIDTEIKDEINQEINNKINLSELSSSELSDSIVDKDNNFIDFVSINKQSEKLNLAQFDSMNVKELQDIARKNRLKIKGRKDELISRIKSFYSVEQM